MWIKSFTRLLGQIEAVIKNGSDMKRHPYGTKTVSILALAMLSCSAHTLRAAPDAGEVIGTEQAILAEAPNVPPPITRKNATKVIVSLEVKELTKRLSDGVEYTF